jgi:hypothetical protein
MCMLCGTRPPCMLRLLPVLYIDTPPANAAACRSTARPVRARGWFKVTWGQGLQPPASQRPERMRERAAQPRPLPAHRMHRKV